VELIREKVFGKKEKGVVTILSTLLAFSFDIDVINSADVVCVMTTMNYLPLLVDSRTIMDELMDASVPWTSWVTYPQPAKYAPTISFRGLLGC